MKDEIIQGIQSLPPMKLYNMEKFRENSNILEKGATVIYFQLTPHTDFFFYLL